MSVAFHFEMAAMHADQHRIDGMASPTFMPMDTILATGWSAVSEAGVSASAVAV